jgi:CubicO group peptidase (beta-lactamase class C family)
VSGPGGLSDRTLADAHEALLGWQQARRIPGMAVVVTDPSGTRLAAVSGHADVGTGRRLSADQRWQIGSVSKAFCAVVLLQLQQEGRLDLGDPLVRHLPWATVRDDVTLHHLLTHTGGLASGPMGLTESLAGPARIGRLGRPQPPGRAYHYSNAGYEALGDVVEAVTGSGIDAVLEGRVLHPLGMTGSAGAIRPADRDHDVRGHRPPRDDIAWTSATGQVPDMWFRSVTADGSIVATPDDVAAYLQFLITGSAPGVLDADGFAKLSGRHVRVDETTWYGYGLDVGSDPLGTTVGHSGGMVGMVCDVRVDRERAIGCAILVNGFVDVSRANRALATAVRGGDLAALAELDTAPPSDQVDDDASGPASWQQVAGQYRAYNPWQPALCVVRVDGALYLADPVQRWREPLVALDVPADSGALSFAVGGPDSPELARFDLPVHGQFQQLDVSGDVYRRARRLF